MMQQETCRPANLQVSGLWEKGVCNFQSESANGCLNWSHVKKRSLHGWHGEEEWLQWPVTFSIHKDMWELWVKMWTLSLRRSHKHEQRSWICGWFEWITTNAEFTSSSGSPQKPRFVDKKNIYNKLNNKDVFTKETGCLWDCTQS